jgi:hypothetical protein
MDAYNNGKPTIMITDAPFEDILDISDNASCVCVVLPFLSNVLTVKLCISRENMYQDRIAMRGPAEYGPPLEDV